MNSLEGGCRVPYQKTGFVVLGVIGLMLLGLSLLVDAFRGAGPWRCGMWVTHCRACHLRSLADLRVLPSTCRRGSEPLDGTSLMSSCPIGL